MDKLIRKRTTEKLKRNKTMIKRIPLKENNKLYFLTEGITQFFNTELMHNDKQMKRSTEN